MSVAARDDALVDEELGGGRARHPASPRAGGRGRTRRDGTAPRDPRRPDRRPEIREAARRVSSRAMLLALDIGNTNVTLGLVRAGALRRDAARRDGRRGRRPTSSSSLLDGLLRLDGIGARPTSTRSRWRRSCRR